MTERGRREYAERLRQRYLLADKRERGRILDEYCRVTECHRKAAIPALVRREGRQLVVAVHPPLPDPDPDATRDLQACRETLSPILQDYVRRFPEQCPSPALGTSAP